MSGAAAIAAAKNRRGREDHNQRFNRFAQKCTDVKGNACPINSSSIRNNTNSIQRVSSPLNPQQQNKAMAPPPPPQQQQKQQPQPPPQKIAGPIPVNNEFDRETLRILKPLHPTQIMQLHELRLNKMDNTVLALSKAIEETSNQNVMTVQTQPITNNVPELEAKIAVLEEVIANLHMDYEKVQEFLIETNATLLKLLNEKNEKVVEVVPTQIETIVQEQVVVEEQVVVTEQVVVEEQVVVPEQVVVQEQVVVVPVTESETVCPPPEQMTDSNVEEPSITLVISEQQSQ